MAKIVVACGSGVATSEMVAVKLRRLLAERGAEAEVVAVDVAHVDDALVDADAFVPVVSTERSYDVPTVSGVAFLTGMNQEDELERLLDAIRGR
ncbi:PTS sugar transporter subunit IIB [Thermophilibacter mediterraneus]|uniref:PTS sugar transporter subunit IIB n=1 Tax=Thermophilibacter mediterraneus TaxID=1871031 RepID=UPI0009313843|nr:PTS sugar transporter subunit IIB [Thermophilibacter mediterraneus]